MKFKGVSKKIEKIDNKIFENENNLLKNMEKDLKDNSILNTKFDFLLLNNFLTKLKEVLFKNENNKYNLFEIRKFLSKYKYINNIIILFKENNLDFKKLLWKFNKKEYDFNYQEINKNFKKINKNKKFNLDQVCEEDISKDNNNLKTSLKKRLFLNQEVWKQIFFKTNKKEYFFKCKWYTNVKIPFKEIINNKELKFFPNKIVDSIKLQNIVEVNNNLIKGWLILDRKFCFEIKEILELKHKILKLELNKIYEIYLFNHKSLNNFYLKDFNIETSINSLDKILLYIILKKENVLDYVSKSDLTKINIANVKKEKDNYELLISSKNNISNNIDNNIDNKIDSIYNNGIDLDKLNLKCNNSKNDIISKISIIIKNSDKFLNIFLLIIEDINFINSILEYINDLNISKLFNYEFWFNNKGNLNFIIQELLLNCSDKELFKNIINNFNIITELTKKIK